MVGLLWFSAVWNKLHQLLNFKKYTRLSRCVNAKLAYNHGLQNKNDNVPRRFGLLCRLSGIRRHLNDHDLGNGLPIHFAAYSKELEEDYIEEINKEKWRETPGAAALGSSKTCFLRDCQICNQYP